MMEGWYGKIIGAIIGYLVGRGLLGAIVGMVLGHQFDVAAKRRSGASGAPTGGAQGAGSSRGDPAQLRRAFFEATFQVMGHVAKSDGRVTEQEIDAAREAMRRFSLSDADRRRAIELFTAGKAADFPVEATLERLRWLSGDQSDLCRLFVQIQLEAALQGNGLAPRPRAVFQRMCRTLGISGLEFASLEAMLRMRANANGYGPGARPGAGGGSAQARSTSRLADAYEVLGVAASAADAEVTRAFRRLMSQNHPDKLVAQGLPESMVTAAHERTQRILEAYETIKGHRGIK
ncbi:MAG TPA: co-chaperone DjlA [Steroidobacteraceae bacterium]